MISSNSASLRTRWPAREKRSRSSRCFFSSGNCFSKNSRCFWSLAFRAALFSLLSIFFSHACMS